MKKRASDREGAHTFDGRKGGGVFIFVEIILFTRGYYMMLDPVIKDGFLNVLLIDNSPHFLFMNQVLKVSV